MSKVNVNMDSNGLVIIEYPFHATITLDDVQSEYQQRVNITNKKIPILVKVHGVATFSDEAQRFICSRQYSDITAAVALIYDKEAGYFEHTKMLLDLFKSLHKPAFDIIPFEDIEQATQWLNKYL